MACFRPHTGGKTPPEGEITPFRKMHLGEQERHHNAAEAWRGTRGEIPVVVQTKQKGHPGWDGPESVQFKLFSYRSPRMLFTADRVFEGASFLPFFNSFFAM